eukprot:m.251664 g.251664  ORF g.251664 m.251664 type:complete len:88 (-) comp96658_c0_seq1:140-403(-)
MLLINSFDTYLLTHFEPSLSLAPFSSLLLRTPNASNIYPLFLSSCQPGCRCLHLMVCHCLVLSLFLSLHLTTPAAAANAKQLPPTSL